MQVRSAWQCMPRGIRGASTNTEGGRPGDGQHVGIT